MTAEQFIRMLISNYGIEGEWPKSLLVDSDTYAHACRTVMNRAVRIDNKVMVSVGKSNGLMFKGIELILKD